MRLESMPRAKRTQDAFKEYAESKEVEKPVPNPFALTRFDQLSRKEVEELYDSPDELFNKASDIVLSKGFERLAESLRSERIPVPDLVAFLDTSARPLAVGAKPIIDAIAESKKNAAPEHQFLVLFHDTKIVEYAQMRKLGRLDVWREQESKSIAAELSYEGDETPVEVKLDQQETNYAKAWDACSERLRQLIQTTTKRTGKDPVKLLFVDDFYSSGRTLKMLSAILNELTEDPTLPQIEKTFFTFYAALDRGQKPTRFDEHRSKEFGGAFLHGSDRAEDVRLDVFAGFPYTKNAGFVFNEDEQAERAMSKAVAVGVKKTLGEPLAQRVQASRASRKVREHIKALAQPFIEASPHTK